MSVHVFFSFSSGLKSPLFVPKGTKEGCIAHVTEVERKLGITREKYKDNPVRWDTTFHWDIKAIDNTLLCETVIEHNDWVRSLHESFGKWSQEPVKDGEALTPEDAQEFWFGLELLDVPIEKWTKEYYRNRMEHLYKVMRGRDSEGVSFDTKALTPRQAAEVIILFSNYLDAGDIRLDVPHGHDFLAASCDGGYEWCEKCGKAINPDDIDRCHRKQCPLKQRLDREPARHRRQMKLEDERLKDPGKHKRELEQGVRDFFKAIGSPNADKPMTIKKDKK